MMKMSEILYYIMHFLIAHSLLSYIFIKTLSSLCQEMSKESLDKQKIKSQRALLCLTNIIGDGKKKCKLGKEMNFPVDIVEAA